MTGSRKFMSIYLDDHVAVLVFGEELVVRTLRKTEDELVCELLARLRGELRDDRREVVRALHRLGLRPNPLKQRLAWAAEKAGRLKLNGRLVKPSPLSLLVELEGVAAVLGASRAFWRTLERSGPQAGRGDAAGRAARMDERLEQVEGLRLATAEAVFGGDG